jgi:hypothetical protein
MRRHTKRRIGRSQRCASFGHPQAGAFFPTVFQLATGGVRIVFADVEES